MSIWIKPYKTGSRGARALAQELGARRIKAENSRFRWHPDKMVINWGSTQSVPYPVVNEPRYVGRASNKLAAFRIMQVHDVLVPPFTESKEDAQYWADNGRKVVCRTLLRADSGRGIVLASRPEEVVDAPLYVQYVPKLQEYRVHVFSGEVIDVQRKARAYEVPDDQVNWQIRNHCNGFVFVRHEVVLPDVAQLAAINAVQCLGLTFGAVDIIYNERQSAYYVLEVNTAPGLEGTTLTKYAEAISNYSI